VCAALAAAAMHEQKSVLCNRSDTSTWVRWVAEDSTRFSAHKARGNASIDLLVASQIHSYVRAYSFALTAKRIFVHAATASGSTSDDPMSCQAKNRLSCYLEPPPDRDQTCVPAATTEPPKANPRSFHLGFAKRTEALSGYTEPALISQLVARVLRPTPWLQKHLALVVKRLFPSSKRERELIGVLGAEKSEKSAAKAAFTALKMVVENEITATAAGISGGSIRSGSVGKKGWALPPATLGVQLSIGDREAARLSPQVRAKRNTVIQTLVSYTGARTVLLGTLTHGMLHRSSNSSITRACEEEKAHLTPLLRGYGVKVVCVPVLAGKETIAPPKTTKKAGPARWDPTLYVLSAALLLSRADFFVGKLVTDFGRTVHELMQARCCEMTSGCLPATFDFEHPGALSVWSPSSSGRNQKALPKGKGAGKLKVG